MSWKVEVIGKPAAVVKKVQEDFKFIKHLSQEKADTLAEELIVGVVSTYHGHKVLHVIASGGNDGLHIAVEPVNGFVE